jgi:hypothetical protein
MGLTGLPNRHLLNERLSAALVGRTPDEIGPALLLLDLDRFKEVNDTLGHQVGDLLLQQIGERLQRAMRAADLVARLGGDELSGLDIDSLGGCSRPRRRLCVFRALWRGDHLTRTCGSIAHQKASRRKSSAPTSSGTIVSSMTVPDLASMCRDAGPRRSSFQTTSVSPGHCYSRAGRGSRRSSRALLAVSTKRRCWRGRFEGIDLTLDR